MGVPFCVKCGRPNDGGVPFVGHLCLPCFVERNRLLDVPSYVEFDYCRSCGSVRLGFKWVEAGSHERACELALEYLVLQKTKPLHTAVERYELSFMRFVTEPSWRTICELSFRIILKGVDTPVEQGYTVELRAKPSLCPLCFDQRGGDYNAVVQLRGDVVKVLAFLEKLLESRRLQTRLVDVVESKEGVDILLRDSKAALRIAYEIRKRFNVDLRMSYEDVGVTRTGKLRRRLTVSVHVR